MVATTFIHYGTFRCIYIVVTYASTTIVPLASQLSTLGLRQVVLVLRCRHQVLLTLSPNLAFRPLAFRQERSLLHCFFIQHSRWDPCFAMKKSEAGQNIPQRSRRNKDTRPHNCRTGWRAGLSICMREQRAEPTITRARASLNRWLPSLIFYNLALFFLKKFTFAPWET